MPASSLTWLQPEIHAVNKLPPRARFHAEPRPHPDPHAPTRRWRRSLDGPWDFHLAPSPEAAERWLASRRRGKRWDSIQVPGNLETQGYGKPQYTNIKMPFRLEPPAVPEDNPTGIYRKLLKLPQSWRSKRVVIHFGGANSVLLVQLNGQFVGVSKDSCLPAEFDLTPFLDWNGSNELVATVIKWSDASYIEDQDQWWLSGLQREVFLYATPHTYLQDLFFKPLVAPDCRSASFDLRLSIASSSTAEPAPCVAEVQLFDPQGEPVFKNPLQQPIETRYSRPTQFGRKQARFCQPIPRSRLHLWSHEQPHLYRLAVSLETKQGTSHASLAVGFRRVEAIGGDLLINGERVLIAGVNRHEHHPIHGKAVPYETLQQDVRLMKQHNFNAVRCSHYPCHPRFIELCNQHGLYVIQEANIESHDYHNELCQNPRYATAWLDRCMRMVVAHQNHPSIIGWSLGNESGYGPNHDAAASWIRHYDDSRLLHYEGAISKWQSRLTWAHGTQATDIICPMYSSLQELEEWSAFRQRRAPAQPAGKALPELQGDAPQPSAHADSSRPPLALSSTLHPLERPLVLCEYSHAMGNSNGSLADYFHLFKTLPGIQGGFIWEWLDHSFIRRSKKGRPYHVYGGDFGEEIHDANFVCDGLVSSERIPHPAMQEHKRLAQPISARLLSSKGGSVTLSLRNERYFVSTQDLAGKWELAAAGETVASGSLPSLKLPPQCEGEIILKIDSLPKHHATARELHLNLRFELRNSTSWAEAGFCVGWAQLTLARPPSQERATRKPARPQAQARPELSRSGSAVSVQSGQLLATFSADGGFLQSLALDGQPIIARGPRLQLWRAAIDNDGLKLWSGQEAKPLGRWRALGLDQPLQARLVSRSARRLRNGEVVVACAHQYPLHGDGNRVEHRQSFSFRGAETFELTHQVRLIGPQTTDLPRVGARLDLPGDFSALRYFGRGPWENYCDRKASATLGIYESQVDDEYVDYVMPQEHGHHTDTRWLELHSPQGLCLRVEGRPTVEFNATRHTAEALYAARHTCDLQPSSQIHLYLDHLHRGLGTGSCGPDTLPQYRIEKRRYAWTERFTALSTP